MPLQPGEIIDGKYRIIRSIGEGGMGAVYEGENTRIKRRVAIKVLHAAVAAKSDVVGRFEREAQVAGTIGSEHIVEVLDLGSLPSGERYMVMEFLDGEDLTTRIKRKRRLEPGEAVRLVSQVLEGLAAAHDAAIIHRDIKPDNIFILRSRAGRADFVKILDFGVSKFSALDAEMSMTRTGAVMGTPYYMSPEQAKGSRIDHRSDIYAIGVVLYQTVTGRVPFNASSFNELLFKIALEVPEPLEQLVPNIPSAFSALVSRAMQRDPAARFQSAREFREALNTWLLTVPPNPQAKTEPLPAMPLLRAPPMGGQLSQSNPALQQMGAGPLGSGGYPTAEGQQPSIPGTHTPAAALAVTQAGPPPRQRSAGLVVALVVVTVAIVAVGAAGVFLLVRTPQAATAPATAGPSAAETAPSGEPVDEAADDDDDQAAVASGTADEAESAAPEQSASPEPSAAPATTPTKTATRRPVHVVPRPTASAKPPPAASSSPPTKTPRKGRNIKTEL